MYNLTDRQLRILVYLLSEDKWVTGSQLAQHLKISTKTIQAEIRNINASFQGQGHIVSNKRRGYRADELDNSIRAYVIKSTDANNGSKSISGREKLVLVLLLFERKNISLETIAERLYVNFL